MVFVCVVVFFAVVVGIAVVWSYQHGPEVTVPTD